uniref:Uncharacterized protein n=1 Tax=Cacopsylla melanoneura TaxID=428564 RepID=A0A8D8XP60_9HEMI
MKLFLSTSQVFVGLLLPFIFDVLLDGISVSLSSSLLTGLCTSVSLSLSLLTGLSTFSHLARSARPSRNSFLLMDFKALSLLTSVPPAALNFSDSVFCCCLTALNKVITPLVAILERAFSLSFSNTDGFTLPLDCHTFFNNLL